MEVVSWGLLEARADQTFFETYQWPIIGGAIALPIQVVTGIF
jgi:hypothetical protein